MKQNTYATPTLELISISCDDIVRTSIGIHSDDSELKIPTIAWKS